MRQPETDLIKDWQSRNPLSQWQRVRDRQLCGPTREFCRDVAEALKRDPADIAVVDTMIFPAMFGAEVTGVSAALGGLDATHQYVPPGVTASGSC